MQFCDLKSILKEKGYIRGPFGSALKRGEMQNHGIPVYEQKNAIYNHRKFRFFINQEKYEILKRFTVAVNDLVISCSGTLGRVTIIRQGDPLGIISQALLILRPNAAIVKPDYLAYYFKSPRGRQSIVSRSFGVAQANIAKRDVIEKIQVPIPNLIIQDKIVNIILSYDNIIENNTRRIQILEEMAQRIYKEWFVDFKYPGHENGQLVDSELGMIPEEWEIISLGEELEITRGKNLTKKQMNEGEIPVVSAGIKPSGYHNESNVDGPAVTISSSGANAGFISLYMGNIWTADCSYYNYKSTNYFFYYYCLIINRKREIDNMQRGAAQPHVYPKDVMSMTIIKPSNETLEHFEKIVNHLFHQFGLLREKNINLIKTRDLLLPKLISGKIDVSDLDIEIGET